MPKARGKSAARSPRRRPPARRGRRAALRTVRVPEPFERTFLEAQDYVARYFSRKSENPEQGTISISGERYILLRAASMSVEFFDLVTSLYEDQGPREARRVASNLLYDVAHAIGKADARAFHAAMGVSDPIQRLSAGPIHFSFSGWAFVDIFPESHPTPGEDYFLIYDHPYSFESHTWLQRGRRSERPVCIMNAGYSSGWCEESFGLPLVAAEIECLAAGGEHCRFVMAPPSRIEEHLRRYHAPRHGGRRTSGRTALEIPEFFERKRMEEELRESRESLERRVEERTAELLATNERLRTEIAERRRAEEVRDEFLSVAAHELKTPLTSLRGFAQLLLGQLEQGVSTEPERLRLALTAIDNQSRKLSLLVSQLLDISRLQAGRLVLARESTDVVALVRGVLEAAQATTSRHQLALRAPEAARAELDPLRLEQVVANLLDNAIKYSPDGGPIDVSVSLTRDAMLELVVADRGIGVPLEHREHIFDRFYQAHGERRFGGMGLGLYISRQIVELHGGHLKAEHPRDGGTWIVLRMPTAQAAGT